LLSRLCDGSVKIIDPLLYEEERLDITSENSTSFVVVNMNRMRNRIHIKTSRLEDGENIYL
jgi:hypothetical protein